MHIGDKVSFSDENKHQFTATVSALRADKVNQDGKVIRSNLIDITVRRVGTILQTYESVPLKSDLKEGENTFFYEVQSTKKEPTQTDKKSKVQKVKTILKF